MTVNARGVDFATGHMTIDAAEAFLRRRIAHANLDALMSAMEGAGIRSVGVDVRIVTGRIAVNRDMEWQYDRDPEDVGSPRLTLKALAWESREAVVYDMDEMSLRDAIETCAEDLVRTLTPGHDSVDHATMNLRVSTPNVGRHTGGGAELQSRVFGNDMRPFGTRRLWADDPLQAFSGETPALVTAQGDWFELRDETMAEAAGALGQTAVGRFFGDAQGAGRLIPDAATAVNWFVLLDHNGSETTAPVTMAAQPAETHDPEKWPGIGHVTGRHNLPVWDAYQDAITALADARGLHVAPNHMGRPVEEPAIDDGFAP